MEKQNLTQVLKDNFKQGSAFTPRVPKDLVIQLVKEHYGLEVTRIKDLASFMDQNFRVEVSRKHENPFLTEIWGYGYTVKFINTIKSGQSGHFSSVHRALLHMNDKGLRVPVPVTNRNGDTFQLVNVPLLNEGEVKQDERKKCGMHILTYIPGETVASITSPREILYQCGETLAKLHNALEDMDNPVLKNKLALCSLRLMPSTRIVLDQLNDEKKGILYEVIDSYHAEIEGKTLPTGFIHGDFNDHNILCQPSETDEKVWTVDGILDFEDMQWGEYIWDVGVLLAHLTQVKTELQPLESAGIALAGYRSLRPLSEEELSVLKLCIECRMTVNLRIRVFLNKHDPSNAYIASLADPVPKYRVLEQLRKLSNGELLQIFEEIALFRNPDK